LPQTAYVDVCDDTSYSWRAKSLMNRALDANVPAITTGGIYPGVSNGAYLLVSKCFQIRTIINMKILQSSFYIKLTWMALDNQK